MYAETDFLLALIKDDDWLTDQAEAVYSEHSGDLWTSEYTLLELLLVAHREDRNAVSVLTAANELVTVRGDFETMLATATYMEDHGLTPFDALHLVVADGDVIVSSDDSYDPLTDRLDIADGAKD